MTEYKMWLDDVRSPPGPGWIVVRSFQHAVNAVLQMGIPEHISFDHDLGDPPAPTGHDFAHWLINRHLDGLDVLPAGFSYVVHSANPPGAANIRGLMESFLRFKERQNVG